MSASNDLEAKILDHIFSLAAYTPVDPIYVALYTADPTESGSAESNEVSGTGYARVEVDAGSEEWGRSGSVVSNLNAIDFGTVGSGGWGTLTHFALVDTASGSGNILFAAELAVSQPTAEGNPVSFQAGDLTVTAD